MKKYIFIVQLLCLACPAAFSAELTIELPEPGWVLEQASPPLGQREGFILPNEQQVADQLWPLFQQNNYEAALALFREKYEETAMNFEQGNIFTPDHRGDFNNLSPAMFYLLGHIYFSLGRYEPAETAFKSAQVILPDYVRVHESLGIMYLMQERFVEAREQLARALELGMHGVNLFEALGYVNLQLNNFWGAASAYQSALSMNPDNEESKRGLLQALSQTQQFDSALTLVEQMLQSDPGNSDFWVYRAHMQLQIEDRAGALASLETAIRLGDDNISNLQVGSTLHVELGSIERAVVLLKAGVAEGLDFDFYDQALAWLIQHEEWDYAADLFDVVQDMRDELDDVQRSDLLIREASLYQHNEEVDAARAALREAVSLNGGNGEALMALANIYREANDYGQAELFYQRASAYDTYRENAMISMAQLAIDQDDYKKAVELLSDVVRVNPARTDLRRNIDILEQLVLASE